MTSTDFKEWDEAIGLRRTIVVGVTLWMTWRSFLWATLYATSLQSGDAAGGAIVIAAVLAPISVLQGYVFKSYIESK